MEVLSGPGSAVQRSLRALDDVEAEGFLPDLIHCHDWHTALVPAYLSTLYDTHFASHAAYKRRQFLHELLPVLFPTPIFGGNTAALSGVDG